MPFIRPIALLLLALPALPAQAFVERFNFPTGTPIIPGWTKQVGTWGINNGRAYATTSYAYLSNDRFQAKDCVLECEVFFTNTGLQFCGLVARYPGSAATSNLVYGKIQNNASGPGYDRLFLYETPGGATSLAVPNLPLTAILRLTVLDNNIWLDADIDKDGRFDYSTGPRVVTTVLGSGLVGLVGYMNGEYDNFKYFDAVLLPVAGSTPKLGTTFKMQLRAPQAAPPPPPTLYFCYASLKKKELPIGSKMLPLDIDVMFSLSLSAPAIFTGFNGMLDANFDAFPAFVIPNNPALVGLELYFGAFTVDPQQPFGLGNIANDLRVQIIP